VSSAFDATSFTSLSFPLRLSLFLGYYDIYYFRHSLVGVSASLHLLRCGGNRSSRRKIPLSAFHARERERERERYARCILNLSWCFAKFSQQETYSRMLRILVKNINKQTMVISIRNCARDLLPRRSEGEARR